MAAAGPVKAVADGAGRVQDVARGIMAPAIRFFWRITVTGREHIPSGPAILAPNHISFLDSAFLMHVVAPRRISFVGKAEYMDSWKTKFLFPAMGMIPIDRSGGSAAAAALDAAERVLKRGELFGIFPEGTRSRDGALYKGHTGAARLALRTGAALLPVGIRGTSDIQPPDAPVPRPFKAASYCIGRPIDLERYQGSGVAEHLVLRQITDELMFEIAQMTGQTYRNEYATKKTEQGISAEIATVRRAEVDPSGADEGLRLVSAG